MPDLIGACARPRSRGLALQSNHPNFDTPNNDVDFFPYYEGPPSIPPEGSLGVIQHTLGSSRFLQLSLHLLF